MADDFTAFDQDLVIHINTVLGILSQLGVGSFVDNFKITGEDENWGEYLLDETNLEPVKTYVYLKTKMVFDPPTSSSVAEAYKNAITELEWRILVAIESR